MREDDKAAVREILADATPDDIPVTSYGTQAYELARATFVVLAREKGPAFAEAVRDELGRRADVLAASGHPWEVQVAVEILDGQFADFWEEAGISGTFGAESRETRG